MNSSRSLTHITFFVVQALFEDRIIMRVTRRQNEAALKVDVETYLDEPLVNHFRRIPLVLPHILSFHLLLG